MTGAQVSGQAAVVDWAKQVSFAVTVCDRDGIVLYMNEKAGVTFEKWGGLGLVGKSLYDCHKPESRAKIIEMLADGSVNTYTIEKAGQKKLVHQAPWFEDGVVAGLVELSIVLPGEMPHFVRG